MWTRVPVEQARQHPLFGVRGSLLVVGCLMILLVLLSPFIQIISKEMASWHNPHFVPTVSTVISVTITWGILRRKAYVRAWVYCWAALTILGLIVLLHFGSPPYFPVQAEDALMTLFIQDIPLCSYFTWSRRARVTLECRVRSDDPFLSARNVTGVQNDAQSADSVKSSFGPPMDHKPSELRSGQQHTELREALLSQDEHKDDLEFQKKFELLLQYSPSVRDAYAAINHLPEELKQRFRAAVLEPGGHHDAEAVGTRLLDEHRKRIRPFDSAEANDFLAKARVLGPAAEKEFMDVMKLLGPSASPTEIFEKSNDKYNIETFIAGEQNMLTFLKEQNFMVRVSKGKSFSPEYRITDPLTCQTTFHDIGTLEAFCRRVWEQRAERNSQT